MVAGREFKESLRTCPIPPDAWIESTCPPEHERGWHPDTTKRRHARQPRRELLTKIGLSGEAVLAGPTKSAGAGRTQARRGGARGRGGTLQRAGGGSAAGVGSCCAGRYGGSFQGQEAPRGMVFLYSLNRLNVATSRARCACVLVANPALFEPGCRSVRQMRLANGVCEVAQPGTSQAAAYQV
jgi:hypothetical protein